MLGQVRGSAGEVGGRAGTYAGLAKPVREEVVENFEDVGGGGDDAREGGVLVVGKPGVCWKVYSWECPLVSWRTKYALNLSGKAE